MILIALDWGAISGGLQQLPRSRTAGQKIETLLQILCGLFSLLTMLTCFWRRKWSSAVHTAGCFPGSSGGLSAFVWRPPMLLVVVLFIAGSLLFSLIILWALQKFSWNDYYTAKHQD